MNKEYIKPDFRVVSLLSNTNIAADTSSTTNYVIDNNDYGFGPWVSIR